ncbi:hypothetical protein [Hyphococcus sp.]|jgi:ABC-type nickel/cobalt efflux system permease component RcnA|uniref:hypothetical protein n=1 Tax=Hyphococcus sp. TaxID=2038636 RepID=UPI003D0E60AC
MREQLDQTLEKLEAWKQTEAAQQFHIVDRRFGRLFGALKAVMWTFVGATAWLLGDFTLKNTDGWLGAASTVIAAAALIYCVWRAYRGLFHAPRMSEVLVDQVMERVKPMEMGLGAATEFQKHFRKKSV